MKKTVLLVLALFVLLLATAGEYTNNALNAKQHDLAVAHQDDDKEVPDRPVLSFDIFNSVIQVSHLVFHSDLVFEFSLPEIGEIKVHALFDTIPHLNSYYKTLFCFIISPNAP